MQERRRRDAGILQVTERDIAVLTWIAEQLCISYDQLQRLLAFYTPATTKQPDRVARSTAQNALERWLHMGYIDTPQKIIREHTTYVWLSRKGIRELELPYAYYTPKPSTITHLYAVNAIRLHLQSFPLSAQWVAQRTLRLQTERRPLPDAHMELRTFAPTALQVIEQPYLASITLQDEIATLAALAPHYTHIRCFVHANTIETIQTALQEHDTHVPPDEQLADHLVWYSLDAKESKQQQRQKFA